MLLAIVYFLYLFFKSVSLIVCYQIQIRIWKMVELRACEFTSYEVELEMCLLTLEK